MISCSKCNTKLKTDSPLPQKGTVCPSCGSLLDIYIFPALFREKATVSSGDLLVAEDEAGCFFHPHKRAVIPCDGCGRFLCALCDIELNGAHLCPSCLESGSGKGKTEKPENLDHQRVLYDSIALALTILPIFLFFWPSVITAPVAIYMTIRYWNAPTSIIGRTKIRFILAFILALAQMTGLGIFVYHMM